MSRKKNKTGFEFSKNKRTEEVSQRGVRGVAGVPLRVVAGRRDPAPGRADGWRRGQQLGGVTVAQLGWRESSLLTCKKSHPIREEATDPWNQHVQLLHRYQDKYKLLLNSALNDVQSFQNMFFAVLSCLI